MFSNDRMRLYDLKQKEKINIETFYDLKIQIMDMSVIKDLNVFKWELNDCIQK